MHNWRIHHVSMHTTRHYKVLSSYCLAVNDGPYPTCSVPVLLASFASLVFLLVLFRFLACSVPFACFVFALLVLFGSACFLCFLVLIIFALLALRFLHVFSCQGTRYRTRERNPSATVTLNDLFTRTITLTRTRALSRERLHLQYA